MKKRCLLFFFLIFIFLFIFTSSVKAEIALPLYIVDEKPRVHFGDTVQVGNYVGLENYSTNYVNGYLHMTYTLTHGSGYYASYPPFLYIRSDDPTIYSDTTYLYQGIAETILHNPSKSE